MTPAVLIAHPTRQHSHRLAFALHEAGWLQAYYTLLPDRRTLSWLPPVLDRFLPSAVFRHSLDKLGKDRVRALLGPLYFQKISATSKSAQLRDAGEWAAWGLFDRWVASQLPKLRPDVVIGYEMCCTETFRVAKSLGISRILDAAAHHYRWDDNILPDSVSGRHTWAGGKLRKRKTLEIDLSDRIVCVSDLAKRTYLESGVEEGRLAVNPPGCDVGLFSRACFSARTGPPVFVFVGQPIYRKGFDLLGAAFSKLLEAYPDAELNVVGHPELSVSPRQMAQVKYLGQLSHAEIQAHLAGCDCLVLPSRSESFGMVVVEALAAGVPVIVSKNVGASMVIKEGLNGWLVRVGDSEDLYERMKSCCGNLEMLRAMRANCPATVAAYDWADYSKRAVDIVRQVTDSNG